VDALARAQADGHRLQSAVDAEYRAARRDRTWGHSQPQIVERWRMALHAWLTATEAGLAANQAALGRFRAAPPAPTPRLGESPEWADIRDALAGKLAVLGALLDEGTGTGKGPAPTPPPRSVWRKR
jgi:hypothetical protein